MRLLLVSDQKPVADAIRHALESTHHAVEVAGDGDTAWARALDGDFALILVDSVLSRRDLWRMLQVLRTEPVAAPIVLLPAGPSSGHRGREPGAAPSSSETFDLLDHLASAPCSPRREDGRQASILRVADLEIDTGRYRVTRAGEEIPLTLREYALLVALVVNERRVLTRDIIQNRVWSSRDSASNTVDVYIRFLRKKIDADRPVPLIQTVRGLGYTLKRPPAPESA